MMDPAEVTVMETGVIGETGAKISIEDSDHRTCENKKSGLWARFFYRIIFRSIAAGFAPWRSTME